MAGRKTDDKRMLDLRRGATLEEALVKRLVSACDAFTNRQVDKMLGAGVRAWPMDGSAPYAQVVLPRPAASAAYFPPVRVLVAPATAKTSDLRHELAHAWDHVKGGRIKGRLDTMKEKELERVMGADIVLWSETTRESVTPPGKRKSQRMTLREMLDAYKGRLVSREEAFDNPATREGYSRASVKEFYAEGYSVYHGHCDACQARMLQFASELFDVLEREAKTYGLRRLKRDDLAAAQSP